MLGSLWGEEFDIPIESEKVKTKKILNKINYKLLIINFLILQFDC